LIVPDVNVCMIWMYVIYLSIFLFMFPSIYLSIFLSNTFLNRKSPLRSRILFASPEVCTVLDPSFLYILISRTYSRFVRKNKIWTLGVCSLQPCPSTGRKFDVSRAYFDQYWPIFSFPQKQIRWNAS